MAQATARFSTRPNIELRLTVNVASHNVGGGYSVLSWLLQAVEMASQPSFTGNSPSWSVNIAGTPYSGTWNFDFSSSGLQTFNIAAGTTNVYHSTYVVAGFSSSTAGGPIGSAGVSGSLGVEWVPDAPTPIGVDEQQPVSLRYRFSGNGNGGSPITAWQAQVATDAAFTQNVQTVSSPGTTTFTGLSPATTYYFRARGANAIGWGPWSYAVSGMTASGAYYSLNGAWVPVPIYFSDDAAWIIPELLISDGSTWEEAA